MVLARWPGARFFRRKHRAAFITEEAALSNAKREIDEWIATWGTISPWGRSMRKLIGSSTPRSTGLRRILPSVSGSI
jgi:hypothetical protein